MEKNCQNKVNLNIRKTDEVVRKFGLDKYRYVYFHESRELAAPTKVQKIMIKDFDNKKYYKKHLQPWKMDQKY